MIYLISMINMVGTIYMITMRGWWPSGSAFSPHLLNRKVVGSSPPEDTYHLGRPLSCEVGLLGRPLPCEAGLLGRPLSCEVGLLMVALPFSTQPLGETSRIT